MQRLGTTQFEISRLIMNLYFNTRKLKEKVASFITELSSHKLKALKFLILDFYYVLQTCQIYRTN